LAQESETFQQDLGADVQMKLQQNQTVGTTENQNIRNGEYAHPEALVNTDWIAQHLNAPNVRIIESNEDVLLYDSGHIPGAMHVDWHKDLNDQTIRDYLDPAQFASLASQMGITPETTLVFYGDKSNWWACYALWVFVLFGHKDLRILNGGRDKWIAERRPVTTDKPKYPLTKYPVPTGRNDQTIRAFFEDTLAHSKAGKPLKRCPWHSCARADTVVRSLLVFFNQKDSDD
jgi:thiosulfate/3-mercaptopyruvate sulfurtransferase